MPLGDPQGGRFEYTVEGLPESIKAVRIPVRDVTSSVRFYSNVLKMKVMTENHDEAVLDMNDIFVMLERSVTYGIDTGIYLGVTDPFEFHRRMVDDGVVFVRQPERGPIGVYASFRDPDSNVIYVVEKDEAMRFMSPG